MMKNGVILLHLLFAIILLLFSPVPAFCQAELEPWGNLRGIRIDGQLMEVVSSLNVVKNWNAIVATAKERQRPKYVRDSARQIVTTHIDSVYFTETVEDAGKGNAKLAVQLTARGKVQGEGIYFGVFVPFEVHEKVSVKAGSKRPVDLTTAKTILDK